MGGSQIEQPMLEKEEFVPSFPSRRSGTWGKSAPRVGLSVCANVVEFLIGQSFGRVTVAFERRSGCREFRVKAQSLASPFPTGHHGTLNTRAEFRFEARIVGDML